MILILFYVGRSPHLVNPPPTAFEGHVPTALFHHRFIDLSLISRRGAQPHVNPPQPTT